MERNKKIYFCIDVKSYIGRLGDLGVCCPDYSETEKAIKNEIEWWVNCKDKRAINKETKLLISYIFGCIDAGGFKNMRKISDDLKHIYNSDLMYGLN